MSNQIILNNWFNTELVEDEDMKIITASLIQVMLAANGGNQQIIGGKITISTNTFSINKGFVYFGETGDVTYINNTGTNQLLAVIDQQSGIALVNANCYIYVKPLITYSTDNRVTTITPVVYSSINPNDDGIKICDIISSLPKNYNKNNISNYLTVLDGELTFVDQSGNPLTISTLNAINAMFDSLTVNGDVVAVNGRFSSNKNGSAFRSSNTSREGAVASFNAHNTQVSLISDGNLQGGMEVTNVGGGDGYSRIVSKDGIGNGFYMQTSGAGGSSAIDSKLLVDTNLFTSANSNSIFIYNCFGIRKGLDNFFTISGDIVMTDAGNGTFLATIPFANINLAGKTLAHECRGPVWLSNAVFSYGTTAPYHASIGGATGASELNVLIQFSGAGASSVIASFSAIFSTN